MVWDIDSHPLWKLEPPLLQVKFWHGDAPPIFNMDGPAITQPCTHPAPVLIVIIANLGLPSHTDVRKAVHRLELECCDRSIGRQRSLRRRKLHLHQEAGVRQLTDRSLQT
eukprot:1765820-Amphidinium_carterae.1